MNGWAAFAALAFMGAADMLRELYAGRARELDAERRLLRERRLAALDEDDRRREPKPKIKPPIRFQT